MGKLRKRESAELRRTDPKEVIIGADGKSLPTAPTPKRRLVTTSTHDSAGLLRRHARQI